MFLVETGRETEISELDVTTSVEQDVVRLDITEAMSAVYNLEELWQAYRWMKPSLCTASRASVISAM